MRTGQRREVLVLLGHEPAGGDGDVLVVGLLGHHPLEALLVWCLRTRFGEFVERQPVNHDAVGYLARSPTFDLALRAQVGDVGDAEAEQGCPAGVVEPAQLAGPKEPARL